MMYKICVFDVFSLSLMLFSIRKGREAILAASLLLSLQSSSERGRGPERLASECFAQLADVLQAT